MGCCNIWRYPPAIDTARGLAYWHSNWGVFAINANDGTVFNYGTGGDSGGFISLTDSGAYKAGSEGALTRHERLSDGKLTQPSWHVSIDTNGSPQLRPPAVTKDGGVVVASRGERLGQTILPGRLASVTADGQLLWNHDVGAVTPPVIGAQDRIFVGTQTAQGDQVAAFDVATGIMLWSAAVSGQVAEVLVGDDDLVYVVAATELYGLDQQTGEARLVVHDMPGAGEAILSSGRVIVAGGGQLVAVPVNAQSYDPAASWPVRFHDNQRTANAQ